MWHLLTAMCVLAMGCYEDPDYTATRFKCDSAHVCPDQQLCVNGACTGSGDGASGKIGVSCGGTACAAGQVCCVDFAFGPSCQGSGITCSGILATCDGVEDCGGSACCERDVGFQISCSGTSICLGPIAEQICRDDNDCTDATARSCCYDTALPGEPWGRCRPGCPSV